MTARLFPEGDDRVPISAALALAAAITALFFLLLTTVGIAALEEGFEGLRPMAAAVAVLFLGIAGMMISVTARWLASLGGPASRLEPARWLLWIIASAGLLVGAYVFFAAAHRGPGSPGSWSEPIAAVLGPWVGLTALSLLGQRLMWLFLGVASVALVSASVAVTVL
jgi:hypothetical protein